MVYRFFCIIIISTLFFCFTIISDSKAQDTESISYIVGIDDVLEISILQPEKLVNNYTVTADGTITFPYIGNVQVKGMTLAKIQEDMQVRLSDGYMKYPIVSVSLKESRSRKFFVYGEVVRPGTYIMEDNITVLRAISIAGGFTKYGSSSRVKVLRPYKDKSGYKSIKININAAMSGFSEKDIALNPGDILVVSEAIF